MASRFVSDETVSFFRKLLRDSVEYRSKENISRDDFVQHVTKQIMVDGKIGANVYEYAFFQFTNELYKSKCSSKCEIGFLS